MKTGNQFVLILIGSLISEFCFGQQSFNSCTAAFVNFRMVVDEYSPKGQCSLPANATGKLTVGTVDLSTTERKMVDTIPFRIAIRDKDTQTLLLFSKEDVKQIEVQTVLANCKKGDRIVLLTVDNRYAMPHNEILVK